MTAPAIATAASSKRLFQLSLGMNFTEISEGPELREDYGVMFYSYAKESKKADYKRTKILYRDLAGKIFIITKAPCAPRSFFGFGFCRAAKPQFSRGNLFRQQ